MRPIDGDALQDLARKKLDLYGRYTRDQFEEMIDSMPTITEEDIARHGSWIYLGQCKCYIGDYIVPALKFACSRCGSETIADDVRVPLPGRCGYCEAVMGG